VCEVTSEVLRVVLLPYEVASPYSIWVSDDSLVVQDIVAPVVVREEDWMEEMVGGVVSVDGGGIGGEQEAVEPPFDPVQLH
jgi:hypothetical protein